MIRSMTGYAQVAEQVGDYLLTWEIRSVNNKSLDLKWKIPYSLAYIQMDLATQLQAEAKRGRVEIFLRVQTENPELQNIDLDIPVASGMIKALEELAKINGHDFIPDYSRLLSINFLWKDVQRADSNLTIALKTTLGKAIDFWNKSRSNEGNKLKKELIILHTQILCDLEKIKTTLAKNAPLRAQRVSERVASVLGEIGINQDRLVQELAILADRTDVSEELCRLDIHLLEVIRVLTAEPAGKRLDFLLQECFREINTCSNKAQDAEVSKYCVDVKANLEKFREQIQNIE